MTNIKEDALERRESVVVLYLTGNIPETISEKLAMPVKTVRSDLKHMGIENLEDNLKSERQVKTEARQEIELSKQELWSMYMDSGKTEEKLKIISEIRELISKKIETLERVDFARPQQGPLLTNNNRVIFKENPEKFFRNLEATQPAMQEEFSDENPPQEFEVVEILPECSYAPSAEKKCGLNCEELPTKSYVCSPRFRNECKKEIEFEIESLLERIEEAKALRNSIIQAKEKNAQKIKNNESLIAGKINNFKNDKKKK
jgi:hypothetical protein